jgi:hypothetical protein
MSQTGAHAYEVEEQKEEGDEMNRKGQPETQSQIGTLAVFLIANEDKNGDCG